MNRIGLSRLRLDDPNTPARSLPKPFALLRSARLFYLFAFESKLSTLINKKSSSASLKRICEPDWIRTNGLLLRRQLLYPTELPVQFRAKIMYLREERKLLLPKTVNIFFIDKITDYTTEIQAVTYFDQLIWTG